jgi:hypothetical protein
VPDAKPHCIAVWGPSLSGKTALLAYLLHAGGDRSWDVNPASRESFPFVDAMRNHLQQGRFPAPTAPGYVDKVIYRLKHLPSGVQAVVSVDDRAGGKWIALGDEEQQVLSGADGLVILVDPHSPSLVLDQQIRTMLERLQVAADHAEEKRPVAICVSKSDMLLDSSADYAEATADPDRFVLTRLRQHIGPDLTRVLAARCPTHRFFPVSAVGVRLQFGLARPAVLLDENLTPRVTALGRSLNLMAPFEWILRSLGAMA